MAKISAKQVSELRSKTGAGMMDCKKALTETDGDIEQAVEYLRKKGLSAAAKKSDRVAAEGLVTACGQGHEGVLLEVNAETDFVAKNEHFQEFVSQLGRLILQEQPADLEALKALSYPETGRSVAEEQTQLIATIGENIEIRRFAHFSNANGVVANYIHAGGRIGVLLELESSQDPQAAQVARQLAMHVAAANPPYLQRDNVPEEVVAQEKDIMLSKAKDSGKPEHILEKIVTGQLNKYYGEVCLLEQAYVVDPDKKVQQVIDELAKQLGTEIRLTRFERFELGEGKEKKEDDFASEVASLSQ